MKQQMRSITLFCLLMLLYTGKGYGQAKLKTNIGDSGLTIVTEGSSPDDYEYTLTTDDFYHVNVLTIKSSKPITISGTSSDNITIAGGVIANVTIDGLSIKNGKQDGPFSVSPDATLNLTLKGKNELTAENPDKSGLSVPEGATLFIRGEGELTAIGCSSGAGIGGNYDTSCGNITIESGTITAKNTDDGPGIGGSYNRSTNTNNGSITITGGNITAIGGSKSACIGGYGGYNGAGTAGAGTILITGGVITALGNGIGGGDNNTDGKITISGNPVIKTGKINTTDTEKNGGILFIGDNETALKNGSVYGNTILPDGYINEEGTTLTIQDGASLIIENDKTLVNNGTIKTEGSGTLTNNGTIHNTGTVPNGVDGVLSPYPTVKINDILPTSYTYIGLAIEPTPTVTDQNSGNTLTLNTDYILTYSNNVNVGTATVIIAPQKNKYFGGSSVEKQFTITAGTLTVTPEDGQVLYQDESTTYFPTYTYSGQVSGETPAFTDHLKWDNSDKKIKSGNLALADNNAGNFKASNYTLTVDETKSFTLIAENIADKEATPEAADGNPKVSDWYTGNVIIKAPTDFKIKQTRVTELRSTDDWTATSLTFDREGKHTVRYQLKRDGRTNPLTEKSVDINLDKSAPTIGEPVKGADGKSFTLKVGDAYSGIASITYNLNSAGETTVSDFTQGDKSYTLSLTPLDYGTHSIAVTVTDVAGHSTTDTRSIELKKTENPDQPVVKPDPIYYTVTIPAVEGATTDPVAGEYQVESWSSFRFYLTLDSDYNQSEPVVTTDRGETLIPRTSDGAYIVKYVRDDVAISIDGIVKNPDPVANEELQTEGIRIYAGGGYLHIQTPKPEKVYIFTPDGRLKTMLPVTDSGDRIALPKGVYFVKAGERVYKTVL